MELSTDERSPPVRVGVVGLGTMGHRHATLVADLDHHLVAGADVSPDARSRFEDEFDGVETYETHEAMYEDAAVDAVIVTTPNAFHEQVAVSAFERDIGVLTEKPLAHTLESAERIAAAHDASDAIGMVGFHHRFDPLARAAREYVADGKLGRVSHVEATYTRRRGVPGFGTWFTSKELAGGGAVVDIGVHILDIAFHLMGFPEIERVSGTTRSEFGARDDYTYLYMWGGGPGDGSHFDVEDSATALVQAADGRTVSLEVAWASNLPSRKSVRLRGTEAGATLDFEADELTLHETRSVGPSQHVDSGITTRDGDPKLVENERFLAAVETGDPPGMNTIDQALTVQRVLDAIYRSSEQSGASVEIGD